MIKLKDISFQYDKEPVLKKLNLEINENGIYSIVGESGSGKTTLFKILTGLILHYEGEYFINETAVTLEVIQNNIAYINQEATVSPNLTVK